MIYLTNGNMPLNAAYADEIVQEDNSTYQLTFRFPTSDSLWEQLKEETFLTADDLHGEQDFVIFEIEKKHGYIQVYANQVFTLLNNYVVSSLALDRATGSTALSRFAGSITRDNPFSFFSDIEDRHTFNVGSKNAMEAFAKDKHSIIGQWGGDLVRHGYQVRLLKNGGSENESLFMYKKNLSSYQHKTSTKSLKTRITFKTTVKGEGEKAPDRTFTVIIDSPLINKYSQIYEDVIEVNDQDVKDEASLRKYGEQYFRTTLCDMMEDSLELEVVGQSDVPVQMFDVVSLFHDVYNLDVRKKITKYTYSPMGKKLKTIGFGQFKSGLANAIGNAVSDAVKGEAQQLQSDFERQLARELKNADLAFDRQKEDLVNQFQDGMNAAYSKAEEVRMELSNTIDQRLQDFDDGPINQIRLRADEILRQVGASSLLAQEAKRIGLDSVAKIEEFKRQIFNTQSAFSGAIDALKKTVTNDIRPKQEQVTTEIAKQVEALVQTKKELAGVKSAQSTFEQSTTRRLSELTNLANGKASKSELTQTAEQLASKIASVQIAHTNQGDRVSAIESNFRQRADALEAGVSRLTEGLRTKADISLLNVTAENIRQSVKSLETNTQNKLDQKLSMTEFEVRASGIRQEIVNATKDKADKTLVVSEAGKIREEFSKMKVGGRNYAEDYDFSRGLWIYSQGDDSPVDWKITNGEYNVKGTTRIWKQMQIHSKEGSRSSWKSSTALLDLEVGETYTLSFQGICYSGSSNVWVSLRANRTVAENPEIMYGNFNLTSSWQTYQVTIPALTKPDNFDFWRIILGYNGIGHVAFRKVELTRSSTRIDAGPAPEDGKSDLIVAKSEFQKTAEGLSAKLATVETYVSQDGQRQEALRRYTREESAKQATSVRELVSRDFVGKSSYQEDVAGINQKIEAVKTTTNKEIATQIANYRQSVDGKFTDISSQVTTYKQVADGQIASLSKQVTTNKNSADQQFNKISGQVSANKASADNQIANLSNQLAKKVEITDFQRVRETSQLYERILGNTENGITDKVARMAMTSQLFQVEVAKNVGDSRNYVKNADFRDKSKNWRETNVSGLNFNYEHSKTNFRKSGVHIYGSAGSLQHYGLQQTFKIEAQKNDKITLSFLVLKNGESTFSGLTIGLHYRKNGQNISQFWRPIKNSEIKWDIYNKIQIPIELPVDVDEINLMFFGEPNKPINLYISEIKLEKGSNATSFTLAPEDTDEAIRSVQSQLAGSWAVQNLTSAGSIVSQINATNNQILIEAEKIRLKGKTLLDELTAIQGYFKRLFVGEGTFATLNTDILRANSITADKLVMDMAMARMFVSSDIFTDTLAAKEAFINKLRSVVVTATLLEGYKGRIGGFQIGTHDKDSSTYWITGQNHFSVGMSNGSGPWNQTALWVNWGNNWGKPSDTAWFVKNTGQMFCYNRAEFWNVPVVHGDLRVTGEIYYNNNASGGGSGYWISSPKYSKIEPSGGHLYLYYSGGGYDWITMNKDVSDRRYKHNIEASTVSGLDVVEKLKTYSYRKDYDGKIEDISCGIMAQDVQKYAPEAFFENPDGAYSYRTFELVPYLIKAIQELNQKIEKMEKTIA